jgi:ABC-type transport system involved in cytochrome bd biosynthesis fused ATPase/permease subunit
MPYHTNRSRILPLITSAATWAATLLIATSIGGLWLLLANRSLWAFGILAVPLFLIAVVGMLRQHYRFLGARRFRAHLDAYADREICRDHWK